MTTRRIGFFSIALTGLIIAAGAQAQAGPVQIPAQKTLEQVVAGLSAKGYRIREIEMDDGHFEATVIDRQNVVREAKIDAVTGEIRSIRRKH